MTDRLFIFDTTLRDGEQSPGASMTKDEKLRIARQLERLKVDVIEAGFAASSNGDFEAVKAIAAGDQGLDRVLARARQRPRHHAAPPRRCKGGESTRIHIFLATSDLHMEKKLRMTREQVFEQARLVGALRAQPDRRRRVLARGRLPLGSGVPLPRPRGGDRRRRDDDQHPRHRRLRRPRAVRRVPARPAQARSRTPTRRSGRCTATTTSAWRWPTRSPASRSAARARSSARSTASASAPATARSRRSSWR